MKTMKKIVAILAVAMMLCSILPLSVFAADTETIKVTANTGVLNGTTSISWSGTNYEVVNDKDNSSTAIRTSDSDHFRVYVGNEFYVRGKDGALMSQVVINCVSSYLINNTANVVDAGWTVSANGTTITYTATEPSAELHISIGKQSRVKSVVITPAVASNPECDHSQFTCGDICDVCGEEFVHAFDNACDNECNNCSGANPNYADHVYDGAYDAACNVCGAAREVSFPAADSELSIPEADAIGLAMSHDTTTPGKYYVTGVVESIVNTTYGNLYIQDENGNKLYVYGTYDATGANRFDAMSVKPEVGMEITVYGVIGNYNNASQMKNAWITNMVINCTHEYAYECSKKCSLCGLELRPEVECVSDAEYLCQEGACEYCGESIAALEHDFDDEWDADCNYGCGYTREVEEKPEITEDTLDFSTLDQRTEYSTTVQVWESNGLVLTNNKGGSTSNVGNYSNPARFYKGSEIIIAYPGMTKLVINAPTGQYGDPWAATLDNAGLTYTVESGVYTITFAAPVDSITLTTTAQVRANGMTATAEKKGDDGCAHNWIDATCTEPKTCSICGAVEGAALGHDWEIISQEEATCTNAGSIVYECAGCGEDKSETFPVKPHTYVDGICSACGAELPLEATITFGEDKAQRTEFTTELQKWEHDGLVLINNKAASTTNIGDYAGRCYKDSEIVISFPGMTSLVIDATGMETKYLWDDTLTNAGLTFTVEEKIYTITFAEPTDSITLTAANQVRANKITATRVEEEHNHLYFVVSSTAATCGAPGYTHYACACGEEMIATVPATGEHAYFDACSAICEVCGYEREVSHNVIHVEAAAATCAANGNIEYWYCDVCGMAWLNAECTMNTNLRAVITPATGEHVYDDDYDADCNVCGDVREVPEKPVEVIYGDADGDGEITLLDATVLTQYLSGYEVTLAEDAADADGDGEITLLDATVLTQYLSGYDVTLGPDEPAEQGPAFNDGELTIW